MTIQDLISDAFFKLNVEPDDPQTAKALQALNLIMSDFAYWMEGNLPLGGFTLTDYSPFDDPCNAALITKLALKLAKSPYPVDDSTFLKLQNDDRENMFRVHHRNSLGKVIGASAQVI